MDTKKPSFIDRVKEAAGVGKTKSEFRQYSEKDLQFILIKARACLQNKVLSTTTQVQSDAIPLRNYQQIMESDEYQRIRDIAEKIVDIKAQRVLCGYLRKLQQQAGVIVKCQNNLMYIPQELIQFQNILWYSKIKKCPQLEQVAQFCHNFFKGVDISNDSHIKQKLTPQVRLVSLNNNQIPFDLIRNQLMTVLSKVINYPLQRKQKMFNLNRSRIEVLRVLMAQQKIVGDIVPQPSNTSITTTVSHISSVDHSIPIRTSESQIKVVPPRPNTNYGAKYQQLGFIPLPHLDADENYSIFLIRKNYTQQKCKFPQLVRVLPYQKP